MVKVQLVLQDLRVLLALLVHQDLSVLLVLPEIPVLLEQQVLLVALERQEIQVQQVILGLLVPLVPLVLLAVLVQLARLEQQGLLVQQEQTVRFLGRQVRQDHKELLEAQAQRVIREQQVQQDLQVIQEARERLDRLV